jgi:hypothetical protein
MSFFILFTVPFKKIVLPVKTHWNSLAMCIESVVQMKGPLRAIAINDLGNDFHDLIPSDRQFDVLQALLKPLLMIKQTSERLSADQPSLHIALASLINIGTLSRDPSFGGRHMAVLDFIKTFEEELLKCLPDYGREVREVRILFFSYVVI